MILLNEWKQQGPGLVGLLTLADGTEGRVVLMGPRSAPESAIVVMVGKEPGAVESLPLSEVLDRIPPASTVAILCAQERYFGDSQLPAIDVQ